MNDSEEVFKTIYEEHEHQCHANGDLGITGWSKMCLAYDNYAIEHGLPRVEDGSLANDELKIWMAASQWGFAYATELERLSKLEDAIKGKGSEIYGPMLRAHMAKYPPNPVSFDE